MAAAAITDGHLALLPGWISPGWMMCSCHQYDKAARRNVRRGEERTFRYAVLSKW
jgi:hypothetical protein